MGIIQKIGLMIPYARISALLFSLCFCLTAAAADAPRPNILYFYVDDMGWGSIGPNGQAARKAKGLPHVLTPNLDRLAAEGVNFARSYGCTVCSPARSSQQTGFHQGHTFADRNDPNNAKKAIRADDVTMGDALSKAGYVTGYWGKWGYGGSKSQPDPEIQNVQTLPTAHGYQHVVAELHHVRAHTFFQPTLWTAPAKSEAIGGLELAPNSLAKYLGNSAYPDSPALQNHAAYPTTAYCDDVYSFAALDFVRRQARNYRATGQPFFGLLAVQVPHAPFGEIEQLPEWDRAYRSQPNFSQLSAQAKQWAAMVTRLDAHFGNILQALEDPNGDGDRSDSVADNTLVIFQSDNGGPQHPARNEFAANGGLSGNKGGINEGGIRVPTIMRWPARITRDSALQLGTTSQRVIDVTDLLPTFCELAGVTAPAGIDGVSLAPTLTGVGYQRERAFLIHESGKGQSIIRGDQKLIRARSGLSLFDLAADPGESTDIAADHPALVKELETLLLGERVAEPRGFANTYHHWTGGNGGKISDADNWSEYEYANAGISYQTEAGAPKSSWNALLENTRSGRANAVVDQDTEFLGLEIRGRDVASGKSRQSLIVNKDRTLAGRNEIRVAAGATLELRNGTVASLRWIDVQPGASLSGTGRVDATLHNQGTVSVVNGLNVVSDYRELGDATLRVRLSRQSNAPLTVGGAAHLSSSLALNFAKGFKPQRGSKITLLKAGSLSGKFSNQRDQLSVAGNRFKIGYTDTSVILTVL
jgi:arylsulfatase A-like enzyme